MSFFGTSSSALLSALSDFWQTLFADKDELNALYAGSEVLLGQAYLDLLSQVLNVSLDNAPLFEKEYWRSLIIRDNEIVYRAGAEAPYRVPLKGGLADFKMLCDRIYGATTILEKDTHFVIDSSRKEIGFFEHPFRTQLRGVAKRQLRTLPVVYARGTDGISDTTDVFRVTGRYKADVRGVINTAAPRRFSSTSSVFKTEDVGATLRFYISGVPHSATVLAVISPKDITISEDVPSDAAGVRWELLRDTVFEVNDVGRDLHLQHADFPNAPQILRIEEVLSSKDVRLRGAILGGPNDAVVWRLQSPEETEELSFWVPAAHIDKYTLYFSFGYLVNRLQPSSESYRALITGIFRYFMLGPALSRAESALNAMVGVPVVRTSGEVIIRLDTEDPDKDIVVTNVSVYDIPKGSLSPDLDVGSILAAFQSLTRIFTVTDYVEDPTWFYGKTVPAQLLEYATGDRRSADPRLYDNTIGALGAKWVIGDPGTFIGADDGVLIVEETRGKSYFLDVVGDIANKTVHLFGKPLVEEDLGKTLFLSRADEVASIESIELSTSLGAARTSITVETENASTAGGAPETREVFELYAASLEAPATLILTPAEGVSFDADADEGRMVYAVPAAAPPFYARISRVASNHRAYLEGPEDEDLLVATGALTSVQFAGDWRLETRPSQRHTTGYTAMAKYLKYHVLYIQYDVSSYNLPAPQPVADIEDVLRQGAPAYTFIYVAPSSAGTDQASVSDDLRWAPVLRASEGAFMHFGSGAIGDGWKIGEWYAYDGVDKTVWFSDIRSSDFGVPHILEESEEYALVFFGLYTDAPSDVALTLYAVNEDVLLPLGVAPVLSTEGSMLVARAPDGFRLAIRATLTSGTPTQYGVAIGYRRTLPGMIVRTLPAERLNAGTFSALTLSADVLRFSELDALKHIEVQFSNDTVGKFYVENVVSETQVLLRRDRASESVWEEVDGPVTFLIGYSRRVMTPHILSSAPTSRSLTTNALYSWPVHATLRQVM